MVDPGVAAAAVAVAAATAATANVHAKTATVASASANASAMAAAAPPAVVVPAGWSAPEIGALPAVAGPSREADGTGNANANANANATAKGNDYDNYGYEYGSGDYGGGGMYGGGVEEEEKMRAEEEKADREWELAHSVAVASLNNLAVLLSEQGENGRLKFLCLVSLCLPGGDFWYPNKEHACWLEGESTSDSLLESSYSLS